jgi:hypothetical protein
LDGVVTTVSSEIHEVCRADDSPTGVTKFNWTTNFPHFRPFHLAATDPSLRHPHIPIAANPPSLLVVPDQSSSTAESSLQLTNAQGLGIKHDTPAVLCSNGISAVIDPAGRILFQQSGGATWSLSLALWFSEGQDRQWTGYESQYGDWLFGTGAIFLSIHTIISFIAKNMIDNAGLVDNSISERNMLSDTSPNSDSSRTLSWSSRTWSWSSRMWNSKSHDTHV